MINDEEKARFRLFDRRLRGWTSLLLLFVIGLIIWLLSVQIIDLKHYRVKAKRQRSAKGFIMRGAILDRNGIKLASDQTSYNIYAHKEYFDHSPKELAKLLAPYLGMPESKLEKEISKSQSIILLKKDVDRITAEKIQGLELREISLDKKNERIYPQGFLAAHVLGYYNPDADVAVGVELMAKNKLEKVEKDINFEKTPSGDIIYDVMTDPAMTTSPLKGKTVKLTLDSAIQHACESELFKIIREKKALRGTAIVMNPKNGEILAYAVYPTYDPNNYKRASQLQLKNWSLTDVYPPGSTFKVLTLASAFENGTLNANSKILDTGRIELSGWTISNYDYGKRPNPGWIDLVYLLEHSSNVGSVKAAMTMTPMQFYTTLKRFGIGQQTGIDLPGESSGLLPDYKDWDKSRLASMGYGYGASVTAIQMISAVSAIGNGGVRVTPHVLQYTEEEAETKIKRTQVMTPEHARQLTQIMYSSIEGGHSPVKLDNYTVAAKTGTSRKPMENGRGYTNKLYTSVVGFLPANNPQVIIYVVVDSASGYDVWGSTVAAPVFREVALQTARILNIPPDKRTTKKK
ncbi:MAG: penicillin-binding protein 2 [Candidatus Gastranaerophilales bacterium]|nr:penicillin-binding protein 2 [Candidatus Gastranaerophilales bacterium]